jgi:flagellar biosynthesis protein FlhF
MIHVTLKASTPKKAYELATEKYGSDFTLVSAKQIKHDDDEKISAEITIAVSKERFLDPNEEKDGDMLFEELTQLREHIAQMKAHLQVQDAPTPCVLENVKSLFVAKGISKEWLKQTLAPLAGSAIVEDEKLLAAYLLEEMDETLMIKDEDLSRKKVMMFVGPTGVGKTTTIAKLAARYAYMLEIPYKVALVNLDSFKVGAFEQLAHFADIMQIKLFTANSPVQFKTLFEELEAYDVILIDTAGMSAYDTVKLVTTVEYLSANRVQSIEVNLVLSATVKYEDIKDIVETFSFLDLDSVILSKFDETKHLGSVLSFLLLNPIPLSYFCIGQNVPDDIVPADKEYFLQRFLGDLEDTDPAGY